MGGATWCAPAAARASARLMPVVLVILLAPGAATASMDQVPTTEAWTRFEEPGHLEGEVTPDSAFWWLAWLSTPTGTGSPGFQALEISGDRIDITYVERPLCPDGPSTDPRCTGTGPNLVATNAETDATLTAFDIDLTVTHAIHNLSVGGLERGTGTIPIINGTLRTDRVADPTAPTDEAAHHYGATAASTSAHVLVLDSEPAPVAVQMADAATMYIDGMLVRLNGVDESGTEQSLVYRTGVYQPDDPTRERVRAHLELRMEASQVLVQTEQHPLRIKALALVAQGQLDVGRASGTLVASSGETRLLKDDVSFEGALSLRPWQAIEAEAPTLDGPGLGTNRLHVVAERSSVSAPVPGAALVPDTMPLTALVATAALGGLVFMLYRAGLTGFVVARIGDRFDGESVTAQPVRRQILGLIAERPGLAMREAVRSLGIGWGAFAHHLAMLRAFGLVEVQRVGRAKCLYAPDARKHGALEAQRLISEAGHRELLRLLATPHAHGRSQSELAAMLGISQSQVSRRLRTLAECGLVTPVEGKRGRYAPSLQARMLLGPAVHDVALGHADETPAQWGGDR